MNPEACGGGPGMDDSPSCDPKDDPECHQKLESADHDSLRRAWATIKTQFNSPEVEKVCTELRDKYAQLYSAGKVF
jgi:hypothetical protein